ncbi:hypothetical protein BM477_00555 [Boudabousia marimammalium]|uniref:Major facilitator superfamily (MFS) profile domain-containing protein n=2 Tax=Boudabousia marimammalium TaxID=156892 RepID=A0A1Q5PSK9_9ACTO|nr:hypothetical protein BM477_00555 [Boudabousia marimammalium]
MFSSYREILSKPGAALFSAAGFAARYPMALISLSMLILIHTAYGNYTIAGQVNAVGILGFAAGAPMLARLVDRYGQAKVMRPAIMLSSASLLAVAGVAAIQGPVWLLYVFSVTAGMFAGSIGAMVRSRWSNLLHQPDLLNTAFALEAALDEIVFMTGPMIATALTTYVHPTAGLIACAVIGVLGGIWFFSLRATEPAPTGKIAAGSLDAGMIMKSGTMLSIAATFVGAGAMLGSIDVAVVEFTKELGVPASAGLQLGIMATGSLLGALIFGSRQWRVPLSRIYISVVIALALGTSTFLFTTAQWSLGIAMFITGMAFAPTITIATTIVQRIVPASRLTEGLTWMNTFMNIGTATGLTVAGRLTDLHGSTGGFFMAMIGGAAMTVVAVATLPLIRTSLRASRRQHSQELQDAISGEEHTESSTGRTEDLSSSAETAGSAESAETQNPGEKVE